MKKLFLLVAIIAMAGIANAQQHCNTNGCTVGHYESDGLWVFGTCRDQLAVDCQNDPYNCGGVGRVCTIGKPCSSGECQSGDVLPWDDGESAHRNPPMLQAFVLKLIPFRRW